ncbi:MAG: thermonuclease family protein [Burkholderiales bacterium]
MLWTTLLCVFTTGAAQADITGRVVSISDGDTVTVMTENYVPHKIRLSGIDAPEKGQAFGQRSKQNLSDLIYNKAVRVEERTTDRYGRIVGLIWLDDKDICLQQIVDGYAWHFKKYQKSQPQTERILYSQTEIQAREAKKGLWLDADPIPPGDWRKGRKE